MENSRLWLRSTILILGLKIILGCAVIAASFWLPTRAGYEFTSPSYYATAKWLNWPSVAAWAHFDGVHYINIAGRGYVDEGRFLPLFPLLIYIFSSLLGSSTAFSLVQYFVALSLPVLAAMGFIFIWYRLLRLDYDEEITWRSILFGITFPTAFFLLCVYTESLFLLLSVVAFYAARKNHWGWAVLAASLLGVTRLTGVAIFPALLWEWWHGDRSLKKLAGLMITPLPLLGYFYFNWVKWGNALFFITAHADLNNGRSATGLVLPIQTLYRYYRILSLNSGNEYETWIALLEVLAVVLSLGLLYAAWKLEVRTSYLIWSGLILLVPLLTGTFTGLPRYILVLFPMYLVLAHIEKNWLRNVLLASSLILQILLFVLFSRGYFIA